MKGTFFQTIQKRQRFFLLWTSIYKHNKRKRSQIYDRRHHLKTTRNVYAGTTFRFSITNDNKIVRRKTTGKYFTIKRHSTSLRHKMITNFHRAKRQKLFKLPAFTRIRYHPNIRSKPEETFDTLTLVWLWRHTREV